MSAIIFDLDGVLIDSEGLQYQAYAQVLREFGITITVEEYARHWIAAGQGPEYAVRTYGLPVDAAQLRLLKHPLYHDLLRRQPALMPGALAALERLHPRFALGIATNSNQADVAFVIDHFGMRRLFTGIITREANVFPKPSPDAILAAEARQKTAPRSCVVVEDTHKGILAAHRAGAVPVAVPNCYTRDNDFTLAAAVLGSLDELTASLVDAVMAHRDEQ